MNKKPIMNHDAVRTVSAELPALAGRILTGGLALLLMAAAVGGRAWADNAPPPMTILTPTAGLGKGCIFVTPTGGSYGNGPEILDAKGNVVWFRAIPNKQVASDFRAQRYNGKQVLTWWQGTGLGGLSCGTDYI
jgi:hypothetical protein